MDALWFRGRLQSGGQVVRADVVGINAGITLLMENARTEVVWKTFMKNPQVLSAMEKVGLRT
jgi:hypothetical protein